ncbi:MAG TPA: [protein-PII] uridylyltransferase [Acidimicrobiales bacterium]|nr:[protein-PII] uridylyltransferase [Acidimicrobiales bacterium]
MRARRQALIDRTELHGDDFCHAYADTADEWLTELFETATGGDHRGMALVAVGGYGRRELCPYSDLDVVLLHRGLRDISKTADRIWYPVWDEGIALDHSVRRPSEALHVAGEDLRAALGLLDARLVCGDAKLVEHLETRAQERWVKQKPPWLGELAERVAERHASYGDVAFLLEPDLKESHGGLRDVSALSALMRAVPVLADYVDTAAIGHAHSVLIRVRVELHRQSGRELNKLLLQEQDQVARSLGEPDTDALVRAVATAGRTVAWEADDAWRRRNAWSRSPDGGKKRPRRQGTAVEDAPPDEPALASDPDLGIADGEVVLNDSADVVHDPSVALRLAAVAAERNLPISRNAVNLLGRKAPAPPNPWPETLRADLVRVLVAGRPAIAALEALDQRDLLARYLPEWRAVRNKPQRNPYHRFTVDRHLLEATANAAALADRVKRVDLLVVGTLLHDIGKGFPGDHTEVGVKLAAEIGARLGFPPDDVDVLVNLVRLHLLLPDMATRRDLDDPATAQRVADEVGDTITLDLLAAMVEADSLATGPSAWGAWKAGLLADLVERTRKLLAGEGATPPTTWVTDDLRTVMDSVRTHQAPALSIDAPTITVIAPDRPRLLAEVTGVLALHGLNVRSANVSGEDGIAVELFTVEPSRGRWPSAARLSEDIASVVAGTLPLAERLADRTRTYRNGIGASAPQLVETVVDVDNDASDTATVVEVRAEDVEGQLHRITQALGDCQLDVISAKVSTFGPAVVDAFYVRGPDGGKLTDPATIASVEQLVRERIAQAPS